MTISFTRDEEQAGCQRASRAPSPGAGV